MSSKIKIYRNILVLVVFTFAAGFYTYHTFFKIDNGIDISKVLMAEADVPKNHYNFISNNSLAYPAENKHCLSCHQGVEPIRPLDSKMMVQIMEKGRELGDPNGCVVCHGGNPLELKNKNIAHSGVPQGSLLTDFTPVPGALHVNDKTCGQCHQDHTYNVKRSLMNTDAGKIKAITWSFGIGTENHDHIWANHNTDDPDGDTPRFGTEKYIEYMKDMARAFPGHYPSELKQVPHVDLEKLNTMPEQAAFTFLRNCNACHLSNKGLQDRGHFRGMGCAACHSVYSNEGFYEGKDPMVDKTKPGHVLVHSMQSSRKSAFKLNGKKVSGMQVSTCAACHSAGRRIGHAYQGLMALGHSDNRGPFDNEGNPQKTNAGYVFKHIQEDTHFRIEKNGKMVAGLLCHDCHSTTSMHGNGNIGSTSLATVEIECADCHGTPDKYPWELPLGYGDEFGKDLENVAARGVASKPMKVTEDFGIVYPKEDGYLLTTRGNPFGNVVRKGNKVIVHSDTGHDFVLTTLKEINNKDLWKNKKEAVTAMVNVPTHMEKLECYACHSTWAPQYYGYKYVIDYSKNSVDWLDSPEKVNKDGTTADYHGDFVMQPGLPTLGDYSHVSWENPALGINGEGRVTPLVGVIQTVSTVIGLDGKPVVWNKIYKTKEGHNAMELAPINPHTSSLKSRGCADCHGNLKAMGYGVDGGIYDASPQKTKYADIVDVEGGNVSEHTLAQIEAISELHGDFVRIFNEKGEQLQTVDSHWPTSMPLTKEQRDVLARGGTCIACHQDIPNGAVPISMLGNVAKIANLSFKSEAQHADLLQENNVMISWVKFIGIGLLILLIPIIIIIFFKRKAILRFFKK